MNSHISIPFLDLIAPHLELEEELVKVFRDALRSAAFIGGNEVERFEQEFADYCGSPHAVAVSSGTDALRFALSAAGVHAGDAVLTVAHTFIATVEAISQAGAATEFVDVDKRSYTMCTSTLESYLKACRQDPTTGRPLGQRTGLPIKAIVPVHLYGQVADLDPIFRLAEEYRLMVIEDACQAHGAEYLSAGVSRRAGSMGKAAAFSFYPGKNLGACGEGGAVTTHDADLARKVRMLRDHGQVQKYHHELEGYNGRLDAIQAAFLRIKLRRLDDWNDARRLAAAFYNDKLSDIPSIRIPLQASSSRSVYHLYVIRTANRDGLAAYLKSSGIGTGLHYPVPVHLQNCYHSWGYQRGSLPVTEALVGEILSLPMYPGLSQEKQAQVVATIGSYAAATV